MNALPFPHCQRLACGVSLPAADAGVLSQVAPGCQMLRLSWWREGLTGDGHRVGAPNLVSNHSPRPLQNLPRGLLPCYFPL